MSRIIDIVAPIGADENSYTLGYINGYTDGECEHGLDWQDIKRIVEIADQLLPYSSKDIAEFQAEFQTEEQYYREVLRRWENGEET